MKTFAFILITVLASGCGWHRAIKCEDWTVIRYSHPIRDDGSQPTTSLPYDITVCGDKIKDANRGAKRIINTDTLGSDSIEYVKRVRRYRVIRDAEFNNIP